MLLLILGVLLWAGAHLFIALAPDARRALIGRLGAGPYKGLFSLVLVAALVLIVFGWRSTPPASLWLPPPGMRHATMLLVPIAVILFISARAPTDIKRLVEAARSALHAPLDGAVASRCLRFSVAVRISCSSRSSASWRFLSCVR
jgi:uncharacterized membrane protein